MGRSIDISKHARRTFFLPSVAILLLAGGSAPLLAGTLETAAGGPPIKPLPPLAVGLTPFGAAHGGTGQSRSFLGASGFIFELTPGGLVRLAGSGVEGFEGDGGPALGARFLEPSAVAADSSGNLWIADAGNFRIRKVDAQTGVITTVVGNGNERIGLAAPLVAAGPLGRVSDLALGPGGILWIADSSNSMVLRFTIATGVLDRAAGTGTMGFDGDGLPAVNSRLGAITRIAVGLDGSLWIADASNLMVRKVSAATGLLTTVAGGGDLAGLAADGAPASRGLLLPVAIAIDGAGTLFIADGYCSPRLQTYRPDLLPVCPVGPGDGDLLWMVDPTGGTLTLRAIAGGGSPLDGIGDGGLPRGARFGLTADIEISPAGEIGILDLLNHRARAVDGSRLSIRTVAGNGAERFSGDAGPAREALLSGPTDIAVGSDGSLLFADPGNNRIRRVDATLNGQISTVAGGGSPLDRIGDGLPAALARLDAPRGIHLAPSGNLWIADTGNHRIRVVDRLAGTIRTVAGLSLVVVGEGDGGPALNSLLDSPTDVVTVNELEYWIADPGSGRVRFVNSLGIISNFAGGGADERDGIPPQQVRLMAPAALALNAAGDLFIADEGSGRVWVVEKTSGLARTAARVSAPAAIALDAPGNLWIADRAGHQVLRLDGFSGLLSPVAGTGDAGFSLDGTAPHLADLREPAGVAIDRDGSLLFSERGNHLIRRAPLGDAQLSIHPASGSLRGGYQATIQGSGFAAGSTQVLFGDTPALSLAVVDAGLLVVTVPSGHSPSGPVEVTVTTFVDRMLIPGGFTYLNDPPVADPDPDDPDDGYFTALGVAVMLDGTASRDPNEASGDAIAAYEWDLNMDGVFETLGPKPIILPAVLQALGLAAKGSFSIALRVTDREGATGVKSTSLTITDLVFEPREGSVNGGYPGRILGTGLAGATGVLFGATPAGSLSLVNGVLNFVVPPGTMPPQSVEVTVQVGPGRIVLPGRFTYLNDPPVARARVAAPSAIYKIRLGGYLVLDGTASSDPNQLVGDFIALHEWDLDGDGEFDRRGAKVALTPAELAAFGLGAPGQKGILLRVTDRVGAASTDIAQVEIQARATIFPNDDFKDWDQDQDQDKVDDRIEVKPIDEKIDAVVIFNPGTDLEAAAFRFAPLASEQPVKIPTISALGLKGIKSGDLLSRLAVEPALFRAEEGEKFEADLDVSGAALKARPSARYSPDTAHDRGYLGRGVNIAIIDSGVDDSHPTLAGKFIAGFNAFTDSLSGLGSQSNPDDDFDFAAIFHGTHVAGVAMGSDPVFKGVAPEARLIDVKVINNLGQGTSSTLLMGIQWCINHRSFPWPGVPPENWGIDVINISLGAKLRSDGKDAISMMVDAAVASGLVVVCSSGNTAILGQGIGSPGAADLAITVAAADDGGTIDRADDLRWPSSNFGPRQDDGDADLLEELKPDVCAPGVGIASPEGAPVGQTGTGFLPMTGSSIAAPHVAGMAALILEAAGAVDPATVKRLIRDTAEPRGVPYDDLLDTTWNQFYGKGIADAFRALPGDLGAVNMVWVSSLEPDNLTAIQPISPSGPSVVQAGCPYPIAGGRGPYGIAVDGKGNVLLADRDSASLTKLNSAGQVRFHILLGSLVGAVPGFDVWGIAVDRENDAWITLRASNRVAQISSTGAFIPPLRVTGGSPMAVCVDRNGNVWIANASTNNVTKLDAAGVEVAGSPFAVGTAPSAITADRAGRIYVANRGSDTITILNPSGSLVNHFPAGPKPVEIALDFSENIWVSNDLETTVTRLPAGGGSMVQHPAGAGPRGISVAGDGTLWTSLYDNGAGSSAVRLLADGTLLEEVAVPLAPVNHGDGTGFVFANSVDPSGDIDGDGWTNAEEIDGFTNPFERRNHSVDISSITPASGSVNGTTTVRINGRGLEAPTFFLIDGRPASVIGQTPTTALVVAPPGAFPPGAVELKAQRPEGTEDSLPAGFTYLNDRPIADPDPDAPNNGYQLFLGNGLVLDGTHSRDPNEEVGDSIVLFEWELNTHLVTGATVNLSAATLASFGVNSSGDYPIVFRVQDSVGDTATAFTNLHVIDPGEVSFVRGRMNGDTAINIADPIFTLQWMFLAGDAPPCMESANTNGDSRFDIADVIYLISFLFIAGPPPPAPYPDCGTAAVLHFGCNESFCP